MKKLFVLMLLSLSPVLANASSAYECIDANGEMYDMYDDSGLPTLRVQTDESVALFCQNVDGEQGIQQVSERRTTRGSRRHVRWHCSSAGQACWGGYCNSQCCHPPSGITTLFWYSCR